MAWVLDLDGVVWRGERPIPGAGRAVARLRAAGERVVFVTNNSSARLADQEARLEALGIPAEGDVVTSAQAGAHLVEPGERVLVTGGPGLTEAVAARGAELVANTGRDGGVGQVDVVIVGFHRDFDYERLRVAMTAVRAGARLVATNDDATFPTPGGVIPGGGAIVAAVAYASGREPVVAGKPHVPMADLVRAVVGPTSGPPGGAGAGDGTAGDAVVGEGAPGVARPPNPPGTGGAGGIHEGTVVGDRPDTDGRFAVTLGYRFALVLSGVTRREDLPVEPAPRLVAADLAEAVAACFPPPMP